MLQRTPLYLEHEKLHARFTEFGGWDMPVQYSSIIDEHNAVRQHAGLFDTSHMGVLIISGAGSTTFLNKMTVGNMSAIAQGKAKYTLFLNENGGIIDDLIVYRRENDFLLVVNAGNREKDVAWLMRHRPEDVCIEDISPQTALLALQGPDAAAILQQLLSNDLAAVKYFSFFKPSYKELKSSFALVARTGYTGEDGFELFINNAAAPALWEQLISRGVKPCGLGCRDTLRLEACMPLHGHEINDDITPLDAGLGSYIYWEKDFIGKEALLRQKKEGVHRFLAAFITDNGIPRAHCAIMIDNKPAGTVTSGTFSPTLKKGIALGYTDRPLAAGEKAVIVIHNQQKTATVVNKPFYKRQR